MGAPVETGALIAPYHKEQQQLQQPKKQKRNYHRVVTGIALVALFALTFKNLYSDVRAGSAIIQHLQEETVVVEQETYQAEAPIDLKELAEHWTPDGRFPLLPPQAKEDVELTKKAHLDRLARMRGNFRIGLHWKSNEEQLKKLVGILQDPATTELPNVVMSGYKYFTCAMIDDMPECSTAGETIWMRSVIAAFKSTNTLYLSVSPDAIMDMHAALGDIITHVFAEDGFAVACWTDRNCIQSYHNPGGIPPHKLFVTSFWGHPTMYESVHTDFIDWKVPQNSSWSWSPLGPEWTLSPYDYPDNDFYLGYSIESDCNAMPVVPFAERNNEIVVLGKRLEYFTYDRSWPREFFQTVADATQATLISTAKTHDEVNNPGLSLPEGIEPRDISLTGRAEYEAMVGSTKAMLGMFYPPISPSPFVSLCQGVPVILPYKGTNPTELSGNWNIFDVTKVQHGAAALIGEPYVYSVDVDAPVEETIEIIKRAISTPIPPFIPAEMTQFALQERVKTFLSIDWELFAGMRMYENNLSERDVVQPQWMVDECEKDGSFCQRVSGYRPFFRKRSVPFEVSLGPLREGGSSSNRFTVAFGPRSKSVCWECEQ